MESIPGLHKRLKIRALTKRERESETLHLTWQHIKHNKNTLNKMRIVPKSCRLLWQCHLFQMSYFIIYSVLLLAVCLLYSQSVCTSTQNTSCQLSLCMHIAHRPIWKCGTHGGIKKEKIVVVFYRPPKLYFFQ